MNYLLDTCVLSEYTRRKPNTKVIHWVDELEETDLYLSTITIGEIKKGIELLPSDSNRKQTLTFWLITSFWKDFLAGFTLSQSRLCSTGVYSMPD